MGASHSNDHAAGKFIPADNPDSVAHRKKIWKTFWIMFAITTVEFIIAFTMPVSPLRISIFVALTIVKAFYIVAEFMHLRYEVKFLINTILIPLTFIVWLLFVLMYEGNAILEAVH